MMYKRILAIESSCDDTACAIVEDGRRVLASVVSGQVDVHARYGGVIPELAARAHVHAVNAVVDEALKQAGLTLDEVDAIAATLGPGLVGALLVGANTAKTLAVLAGKPFIGVHHLHGHIASNYLESDLKPPYLCLLVSGGHTQLMHVKDYGTLELLGETLDDAVGEVYDKLAREMGLGFPGGKFLDELAQGGKEGVYSLPIAKTKAPYDFSFSGLKTAALRAWRTASQGSSLSPEKFKQVQADMAASFQITIVETLMQKLRLALAETGVQRVALCGGVSANSGLRAGVLGLQAEGCGVHIPALRFCTDNAAMIAAAAYTTPLGDTLNCDVFSR